VFIHRKLILASIVTFGLAGAGPALARSGRAVELTPDQLDRVTAGTAVAADANSAATGVLTIGITNTNAVVGVNRGPNPTLSSSGGLAVGAATSFGTNLAANTGQPATSGTSVTTGGSADGNFKVNISNNQALSALGVTIQVGFTSAYGAFALGL